MPKIAYEELSLSSSTLAAVEAANVILSEYAGQGYTLTLRQLYYQFVSRALIPNTDQSYKRLGDIVAKGRRAGLIDWESIEDRTRFIRQLSHWGTPAEIIEAAREQFRVSMWERQSERVEVWIEKDALIGVIEPACQGLDVPFFSCRGYVSESEMWRAGVRISLHWRGTSQKTIILHFGDHDPSGIDMSRDIEERLDLYTHSFGERNIFELRRLALNMDQIKQYNPPPNPAKLTDSRCQRYIAEFGRSSWELDALTPRVISDLITKEVDSIKDASLWTQDKYREYTGKEELGELSARYEEAIGYLEGR